MRRICGISHMPRLLLNPVVAEPNCCRLLGIVPSWRKRSAYIERRRRRLRQKRPIRPPRQLLRPREHLSWRLSIRIARLLLALTVVLSLFGGPWLEQTGAAQKSAQPGASPLAAGPLRSFCGAEGRSRGNTPQCGQSLHGARRRRPAGASSHNGWALRWSLPASPPL